MVVPTQTPRTTHNLKPKTEVGFDNWSDIRLVLCSDIGVWYCL
jgi:hypothetical protein